MTNRFPIFVLGTVLFGALHSVPARAEDAPRGYISVGAASIPEFDGSADQRTLPTVAGWWSWGDRGVSYDGLIFRADVAPDLDRWRIAAGPALSYRFGRKDADNAQLAALAEIDDAIEAGGFIRIQRIGVFTEADALGFDAEILTDISGGHEGTLLRTAAIYDRPVGRATYIGVSTGAVFSDKNYARAYYGVSQVESVESGLTPYEPDSGLIAWSTTAHISQALSKDWMLSLSARYDQLTGDLRDSPIPAGPGSDAQLRAFIGIGRLF